MDAEQRTYIEGNNAAIISKVPTLAELRRRLLEIGGLEVVFVSGEEDLNKLLKRGKRWPAKARMYRGASGRCHSNTAGLWEKNPTRLSIITGWALSDDGLWRQHTWAWDRPKKQVMETTLRRTRYFGFELTAREAEEFSLNNFL